MADAGHLMDPGYTGSVIKNNIERCENILFDIEVNPTIFNKSSANVLGVICNVEEIKASLRGLIGET